MLRLTALAAVRACWPKGHSKPWRTQDEAGGHHIEAFETVRISGGMKEKEGLVGVVGLEPTT